VSNVKKALAMESIVINNETVKIDSDRPAPRAQGQRAERYTNNNGGGSRPSKNSSQKFTSKPSAVRSTGKTGN
jgi:hypothetical protein